ncbi:MAG: acetolactate synthase large subunit [Burkholderiaceae bacterium]
MNGAQALVRTLSDSGVDTCFVNPGTSEMHFVAALDSVASMRAVLCLFEGVVTGAADGYGRMTGKPAATLLHLGPGLANGLANLHNAKRAATPVVNIVGDHATYHLQFDTPLTSDIAGFARPVSHWIHKSGSSRQVAADAARAVQAALRAPGQIATLILPADTAWNESDGPSRALPVEAPAPIADGYAEQVALMLTAAKKPAILIRGESLYGPGLEHAGRISAKLGARVMCDTFAPRLRVGAGVPPVERIPYFAEQIVEFLGETDLLILVGTNEPVSFFAYPGKPSICVPESCRVIQLAHAHEDGPDALEQLCHAVDAHHVEPVRASLRIPDFATGKFNQVIVATALARLIPADAILIDEAATNGGAAKAFTASSQPHDLLSLTGGAIGMGLPLAIGAAVAEPNRKVVCLHGDGGAMYTVQSLWTMARENLDIVTVIFANRSYKILNVELARVGVGEGGPKALSTLDIGNPNLNWVSIASGMGVESSVATNAEEFNSQFAAAMAGRGPRLIEAIVA